MNQLDKLCDAQLVKPFISMDDFETMSEKVKDIYMPKIFYSIQDIQEHIEPDLKKSLPFAMKLTQQTAITPGEKAAKHYLLNLLNKTIIFD